MATETTDRGLNPYAAPRAQVDDHGTTEGPAFFAVTNAKLVVMSLVTFNLYLVWWFYWNWKCAARLNDEKLSAPIRALFYGLTSYWLFARIKEHFARLYATRPLAPSMELYEFDEAGTYKHNNIHARYR